MENVSNHMSVMSLNLDKESGYPISMSIDPKRKSEVRQSLRVKDAEGSSMDNITVRPLTNDDITAAKELADENRDALGFLPLAKLIEAARDNRALVASINGVVVAFVLFRHRKKDLQTTLSDICVSKDYSKQGIGKMLVDALLKDCCIKSRDFIQLKCPIDLPANCFYEKLGFSLYAIEDGKKRQLKVWRLLVPSIKSDGA